VNSVPSPGDGVARFLKYVQHELKVLGDRIAALSRRVKALEDEEDPEVVAAAEPTDEVAVMHMKGALGAATSDSYPVARGGAPLLLVSATIEPAGATLTVLRNGTGVDTFPLTFVSGQVEYQVDEVFERGDEYALTLAPGTGGSGLVVAAEFRQTVA
jgi:hypothetical protein